MKKYIIPFISLFMLVGCTKDLVTIEPNMYLNFSNSNGVFIGCEGSFMYGNASLSYYDKDTKEYYNQVFFNTNNFPLGDVLQSTTIIGDQLFLAINGSGKIYIINKNTMRYENRIAGLVSPRYIELVDDTKAYISDLYSPSTAILNLETLTIEKGIFVGFSPTGLARGTEEMIRHGDFIYTCSWSFGDKVYKIDTRLDRVVDSLTLTKQPNSLVLDKNNKLWILSDGGYVGTPAGKVNAALTRIDTETFEIEQLFSFNDETVQPSRLKIDPTGEYLYYVYGSGNRNLGIESDYGVYRMSINATDPPETPHIKADHKLIYSLGIDPHNGDIYVGDAIDYVQKGIVYRHSEDGAEIDRFSVGITPGSFTFK